MRAALVIAGVCASGAAVAAPAVQFQADANHARVIATIDGAGNAPVSTMALVGDGAQPQVAPAYSQRAAANEPVEIALVINGQEIWIGNDDHETDDNARYLGVLHGLERALDHIALGRALPEGSMVSVVSYATGAEFKVPVTSATNIHGASLGTQRDYRNKIGTDMVQGIELAMSRLAKSPAPRRVLIVLGDGNDTNDEAAKVALLDLKKRAAKLHVMTYGIIYKSVVSADGNVINTMIPRSHTMNSIEGIEASLQAIVSEIADRQYVAFDASTLPWDGRMHDLTLTIDGEIFDTESVVLPARPESTPWWRHAWLAQLVAGFVLVGAWVSFARWRVNAAS
jgi:hypothetical protein